MKMILALMTLAIFAVGCDRREASPPYGKPTTSDGKPVSSAMVKDPVCEMMVDSDKAKDHSYKGVRYYFCSQKCHDAFEEAPQVFVDNATREVK